MIKIRCHIFLFHLYWAVSVAGIQPSSENLIGNGGFEEFQKGRADQWSALWTREPNTGEAVQDTQFRHAGKQSLRINHTGEKDWCVNYGKKLTVQEGDMFNLKGWMKIQGRGETGLAVITYDKAGKVSNWSFGGQSRSSTHEGNYLQSRFIIPKGVSYILPRLLGSGSVTVWWDEINLVKEKNVLEARTSDVPSQLELSNDLLSVVWDSSNLAFSVTDRRTGQTWKQVPLSRNIFLLEGEVKEQLELTFFHAPTSLEVKAKLGLESDRPEVVLSLSSQGRLSRSLHFPHPFVSEAGTYLVVPMNEGISYPVEDITIKTRNLIAYGGHGICMGFWGVTDGRRGHMAIIETADDATIRINRQDELLYIAPQWDSQKGKFGYSRRLRYVFFEKGGHVAICKRYREYVKKIGRFKTLRDKRKENPHVDRLIGAVNVWCWDKNPLGTVKEMQALGIKRILWSRRSSPGTIENMNALQGVLTSRYDIYQDLMDPEVVKEKLWRIHGDWTQGAWPNDLMLDGRGEWRKGWRVKGKDGNMYPCGVLCDGQAPKYARTRVFEELKTHAYRCRFIDTTTASAWRECYHPDHPMTRSESREGKMELLQYVSEEMKLVTGSETGHDAAVPFVHYFEGMLSLGPYRVPDAGRNMIKEWHEVPERVAKFQLGHRYRLPLWELVYHDCVVAQWYWGDYNNKLPALWDKRDLFNILYGTPPMFMFNRNIWQENKERFVQSYANVCKVARLVGYAEMTDHRFLTANRDVQQTVFSNGITVTVNFGNQPHLSSGGSVIAPLSYQVITDIGSQTHDSSH